ncbi:DUF2169 family type VI secretion system accessory protein [Zoogloea dura]|uniref:DUF2169 domain-containing protein n=1 Tax=Zoogloea dura TaxID=2728840 RepID=A0A848FXT4_9RHOO|nr:DUF2169 domain-containing protein [Zoogloea dura]NML24757.1 DUF2169 domain-containing protein [Zoogloea dura]
MLQVLNTTPYPATLAVFPSPGGVECAYAAVKVSYDLSTGVPQVAASQAMFLASDVYWGDPASSSLRAAADLTLLKPSTDVLLLGRAVAPAGPVQSMEVALRVGTLSRRLRVFGERVWQREGEGWRPSAPKPFERLPLRWELAFGGQSRAHPDHPPEAELRNPVGRGFVASWDTDPAGLPLPCIEDPEALLRHPHERPEPAGMAPVAAAWLGRARHAGTYDAAWQKSRAPYLPLDFDPRFFHVAPPALIAPQRLVGGESVELDGMTGGGRVGFTLPRPDLHLAFDFAGRHIAAEPLLDTVLIEPDMARLQMVWRAELAVDKHLLKLRALHVSGRAEVIPS